jgi:hypothetical protein
VSFCSVDNQKRIGKKGADGGALVAVWGVLDYDTSESQYLLALYTISALHGLLGEAMNSRKKYD